MDYTIRKAAGAASRVLPQGNRMNDAWRGRK
jgi:hypothetical protein